MCFSATASFGVAAVLGGVGVVSIAQKKSPSHRLLAWVPLMFAVQQVAEGVVWLTIHDGGSRQLHALAVSVFLGFALIVWPTWMPFSLLVAETRPRRRAGLRVLAGLGACVSTYAGWILVSKPPVAIVAGHSIEYSYADTGSLLVLTLYLPAYLVSAVIPFFVSTMDKAKLMGGVLAASLLATFIIKRETLTSVWCFFAAVMSGVIVMSIAAEHRLTTKTAQ